MAFGRIPLPQNGMDAFLQGLTTSQSIFNSLVKNKLTAAQTSAVPSEINLRNAQASEYPSLIQLNQANASAVPSEINLRTAQAGQLGQEALKQKILNQTLPQRETAEIGEIGARTNYYNQGGGRGGVSQATERAFENSVLADNPEITDPDKQRELINAVTSGATKLSDGTSVNPMTDITRRAYDRAYKTTTTAQALNQGIQANQAAAEIPVVNRYINEGVKPYGTTTFGISPLQIKDSLDVNNPEAQNRLGNFIAAQALNTDYAALNLRINGLPPGQKLASKVMELSGQYINGKYPSMPAEARAIASRRLSKALSEILEARNKYGVGASGAAGKINSVGQSINQTPEATKMIGNQEYHKVNGQWLPVIGS